MPRGKSAIGSILARFELISEKTAASMRKELARIEEQKARLTGDLDTAAERIRRALKELGHTANGNHAASPKVRKSRGRRSNRTPEQLKREAEAAFQVIKGAGAEGASGREIRKAHPGVGAYVKDFIQKYTSHKIRTTGKKVSMRYHAA